MAKQTFYITTPIYYPSGKAHIGHAYCTICADVIARFKRLLGFDVVFLTGTDEHGQKIENKAKSENLRPQEYVDKVASLFKDLWKVLNISNDKFMRTTEDFHKKSVQKIFSLLYEKGDIYKGAYEGWYCEPCEAFWTKTQIKDGDGKCPDCKREVHWAQEEAYFFKLSNYVDKLVEHYKKNPNFVRPKIRENEMVNFIKAGLGDICVSRTSFSWGVPVTFDKSHVVYVWLDALTNYITALGFYNENEDLKRFWPADAHFVGKEIMRFHAIIWPAILMALNLELPKTTFGHGWWLSDDSSKMSKSKGNVIDPLDLCKDYGVDAVRYFLLREVAFGSDGVFSFESLLKRYNSDLANDLGNLVSRTSAMADLYFGGVLNGESEESKEDEYLISFATSVHKNIESFMNNFEFSLALLEIWKLVSFCNKYIEDMAPWNLAKNNDKKNRLRCIIYNLSECIRIISIFLSFFMPETSLKIREHLSLEKEAVKWEESKTFGLLPKENIIKKAEVLFPRIYTKN